MMNKKMKITLAAFLAVCSIFTAVGCASPPDSNPETNGSISPPSTENSTEQTPDNGAGDNVDDETTVVVPESPPKPTTQQYIRCTGNNVNIRSGAGKDFTVLGQAEQGTMYAITGKIGNWYQTYYRGKTAYIYTEYAAVFTLPLSKNDQTEEVIKEAYKHIGVPYVYGAVRLHDGNGTFLKGFTAQKFDCSSLVQYVYYHGAGKLLNTTTRTQIKQGKYVHPSDLQRGDCIFFTNETRQHLTGIERVGHVAIYLGNNYILHTASDYARIEKMSNARWNFYIEARRFV
ncbi:MAG: C40 family peptidase [Clostridia bacterium]|nr:C40 family peptidase [Clostridia bacterium]